MTERPSPVSFQEKAGVRQAPWPGGSMDLDFGVVRARRPELLMGWDGTLFLAGLMAPDGFKRISNTWLPLDPPQLAAKMEGVPFAVAH